MLNLRGIAQLCMIPLINAIGKAPVISLYYCSPAGENESWWLSGVGEIFGSSLTAATSSVLQSELGSCQELMEEEPENKCEV